MKMNVISIVYPSGSKIANGEKTIEVRYWLPTIHLGQDMLIVENHKFLYSEGEVDPDGKPVAIVKIKKVRDYVKEDIPAACASRWDPGYYSWELEDVRPIRSNSKVVAARGIYEVEFSPLKTQRPKFAVRKATNNDIEQIAFINAESWKTTYRGVIDQTFLETLTTEKQLPRAKRLVESFDIDCIVVYERDTSNVIGFACFGKNREKNVDADSELQAIYLLEQFQGFWAGKILLDEGVRILLNRSSKRMMVSVFEANKTARSFYEKQGGKWIGSDHVDLAGTRYPTSTYLWEFE